MKLRPVHYTARQLVRIYEFERLNKDLFFKGKSKEICGRRRERNNRFNVSFGGSRNCNENEEDSSSSKK